jgi:uncharacterized protein (UPF0332 family)
MSPRSEEFMSSARDRLRAARAVLEAGFPAPAASEAYYAALYAARAALSERDRYAKTHAGTWTLFFELFVSTGRFDPEVFSAARRTQEAREQSDYEAATIPPERAQEILDAAQQFVDSVAAMVAG